VNTRTPHGYGVTCEAAGLAKAPVTSCRERPVLFAAAEKQVRRRVPRKKNAFPELIN